MKYINKIFIFITILVQVAILVARYKIEVNTTTSSTLITCVALLIIDALLIWIYNVYTNIIHKNLDSHLNEYESFVKNVDKTQNFILFFCWVYGIAFVFWLGATLTLPYPGFSKIEKYQGRVIRTNDRILIETKTRTTESFSKEDYDLKNPVLCVEETYSSVRMRLSDRYYICDINFSRDKK